MNPEKLIVHAYDPPCHYRLPAQWPSTCRVQAGSQPSCSSLGKTWCSALPSASPILRHSCCYQGTHVSTWVTGGGGDSRRVRELTSVFLLPSRITYCMLLPRLSATGRKRRDHRWETSWDYRWPALNGAHPWPQGCCLQHLRSHVLVRCGS